ncbi:hypothetical protein [Anabaena sp. 4-3]|uniref:hypothetical protein n=1 Tax=Anabaena sp. 4-3 TaxID=1811979 RepID=UPI00083176B0|nr:hypothetical protein [Anabaena sp. 4-3]
MNPWYKQRIEKLFPQSFAIFRWLITLVLAFGLTNCGDKAVSQEVAVKYKPRPQQISQQFSEVSPPTVIQELSSTLEIYRPQVKIITPQPDEVINDNTVTVRFQVKDLPIFKHPQWELGPHLHVFIDNQPYIPIYDLEQPLVLSDLSPGTHTVRVFASRPWHESFKNEGAYAQTTFHIFTKTDDNNPDTSLPLLTYSRPQGNYGAEPILLDFYLNNAPLHLVSKDQSNDKFSDWRIRCTINGESFVLDRWQSIYLKGFKPGNNWVKLEFLDNQGNPVKNTFNTTVRLVNYQPKGKDTLSRITRGELQADEVRGIVDPNYTAKQPVVEPIPTPTPSTIPIPEPTLEPQVPQEKVPTPEVTETPQPIETSEPEVIPTPEATASPETVTPEPEKSKFGGFFKRPRPQASPSVTPTPSEVIESPISEPQPEVTTTPSPTITPEPQPELETVPEPTTSSPTITPEPQPKLETVPEPTTQSPKITPELQPEITPTPQATELPQTPVQQPKKVNLGDYFKYRSRPNTIPSPSASPTPNVTEQSNEEGQGESTLDD